MIGTTAAAIGAIGSRFAGETATQIQKPAEPPQIQLCVQLMEEEAKRLRAAVEHLAGRLHDVLTPVPPANQTGGEGHGKVSTCPLTDILTAQIGHIAVSRSIVEDLLGRIQL